MAPKNIDETIKKLLNGYAKHCAVVLAACELDIQKRKYSSDAARKQDEAELARAKQAYAFLQEIVADPKKYLYSGKDIIYTVLPDGKTVYDKLAPILTYRFDCSGQYILNRLSEKIAHHVKYGQNNVNGMWVYYDDAVVPDVSAMAILEMNKFIDLLNSNDLVAAFKGLLPASMFAVDAYSKSR